MLQSTCRAPTDRYFQQHDGRQHSICQFGEWSFAMKSAVAAMCAVLMALPSHLIEAQSLQVQTSSGTAAQSYVIQFPRDLYDHPGYQTEWWYFTGNLESREERQYGFELTFFRSYAPTGAPAGQPQFIPIIFADLAVSDLRGQQFFFHKALAPEAPPAASITQDPWTIQLGGWTLTEPDSAEKPRIAHHDLGHAKQKQNKPGQAIASLGNQQAQQNKDHAFNPPGERNHSRIHLHRNGYCGQGDRCEKEHLFRVTDRHPPIELRYCLFPVTRAQAKRDRQGSQQ